MKLYHSFTLLIVFSLVMDYTGNRFGKYIQRHNCQAMIMIQAWLSCSFKYIMTVTKTPMIAVYKQDKFSTAEEEDLHFLEWVNKDLHMDNYHKADWSLCKINHSKMPVTWHDERQYEKRISHKCNFITASKNKSTKLF